MVLVTLKLTGPENNKGGYTIDKNKPITSGKSMTSRQFAETDHVLNVSAHMADFFKMPDEYKIRFFLPNTGSVLLHNASAKGRQKIIFLSTSSIPSAATET
jgi:hypothetical protein